MDCGSWMDGSGLIYAPFTFQVAFLNCFVLEFQALAYVCEVVP